MSKLIFRLFFAKEFRKMARARQELGQLSPPAIKDREDSDQSGSCSEGSVLYGMARPSPERFVSSPNRYGHEGVEQ
jgi:hypothetical protein